MPILLCLNKTGPLESNFINKIITKNTGDKITSSNPYYRGNRYDCGIIVRVNNTMLIDTGASSLMCWDSFGPQILMIQKAIIS